MSREILDCLKRKRDICIKNIIPSQNTAFMFTPTLSKGLLYLLASRLRLFSLCYNNVLRRTIDLSYVIYVFVCCSLVYLFILKGNRSLHEDTSQDCVSRHFSLQLRIPGCFSGVLWSVFLVATSSQCRANIWVK